MEITNLTMRWASSGFEMLRPSLAVRSRLEEKSRKESGWSQGAPGGGKYGAEGFEALKKFTAPRLISGLSCSLP
jgi:hypothetical protein